MVRIKRKSQGMPINVIIIAALCLLVLFVLIYIFTGQTGKAVSALDSCAGRAGECKSENIGCLESSEIKISNVKCPDKQVCCIKIFDDKK